MLANTYNNIVIKVSTLIKVIIIITFVSCLLDIRMRFKCFYFIFFIMYTAIIVIRYIFRNNRILTVKKILNFAFRLKFKRVL